MKIENNAVVRFHYTVAEEGQAEVENSRVGEPVTNPGRSPQHHLPGIENGAARP